MPAQLALPIVNALNAGLLPEANLLHDAGQYGFFSLLVGLASDQDIQSGRKPRLRQRSFRLERLSFVLDHLDPTRDSYLSQGEFFLPNRRVVNLLRISTCFADLDVYRTELSGHDLPTLAEMVRRYCGDEGIPRPSLIVSSGRGLYVKWLLDRPLPQAALPRWNAVQRELVRKLAPFAADPKAVPASQVLRLVQTVNSKSGEFVRVLYVEESRGKTLRWDFDSLANEVLPWTREELEALRTARATRKELRREVRLVKGGREGPARFSARRLAWARLLDIRTLRHLRGGVIEEGMRELTLFYALTFLLASGMTTAQEMFHESRALATEINPNFVQGREWHKGDLSTLYQRAKDEVKNPLQRSTGLYWVKNDTLIEVFKITSEEQREMQTIISKDEKYRRNNLRRREARRVSIEARAQGRADRNQAIRSEASEGVSQKKLAERWGLSRVQVQRVLGARF